MSIVLKRKYRVYSIEYRVKKEKKRYKKVVFFLLSNYPTKVYTNDSVERIVAGSK